MNRFPTAADIDAILPDTAVWLERADGHAGWANSRAMTMAGITATTKSPEGGRIEMTGGKPNGMFVGSAKSLIEKVVPAPLPTERDLAFAKAQQTLLSHGVTAISDIGTTIYYFHAFRRSGARGYLR